MEFITGVITETSSDYCVVKFPIDDAYKSFSFHKSIFYLFGVKCDGSMTNILEGDIDVDLCYRISHTTRKPVILAVWCGEKPPIVDASPNTLDWYDQQGHVSYYLDSENVLVENDAQNHTVIISVETVYRDGVRMTGGARLRKDDHVYYDAVPLDFEHPFGASFQATCAWLGTKPRLVDRFALDRAKDRASGYLKMINDIHGIVLTVPSDILGVVEVKLEARPTKVLLFRSSFEVVCGSIRDMVRVGDAVCMCVTSGHIFEGCKLWYACKAFKVCQQIEAQVDDEEVPVIVSSDDFSVDQTLNEAKVYVAETSNDGFDSVTTGAKVNEASYVEELVTDTCKNPCCFDSSFDSTAETGFISVTKLCDYARKGTQTGTQSLIDVSKIENVTGKTVRNYVGIGVNSVLSRNGVKEVLEVAEPISTYSSIVKEGSGSPKRDENVGQVKIKAGEKQQGLDSDTKTHGYSGRQSVSVETRRKSLPYVGKSECVTEKSIAVGTKKRAKHVTDKHIAVGSRKSVQHSNVVEESIAVDTKQPVKHVNVTEGSIAVVGTKQPVKHEDVTEESIGVGTEQSAKHVNVADENDSKVSEAALGNFAELNKELNMLNNNISSVCKRKLKSTEASIPLFLYNDPPLSGTISRFALDCGCVKFKNFRIFVKPDNFYIDGVRCPVKHFVKYARAGSSFVNFEAILRSDSDGSSTDFTHEATCAWVGKKPSLVAFTKYLPPAKTSLLELHGQDFCGVVSNLYLPDSALVVIHGDESTVVVQVDSFPYKPQHSEGNLITDFVKLNDILVFKIKEIDSEPNILFAWDVRISSTFQIKCKSVRASD